MAGLYRIDRMIEACLVLINLQLQITPPYVLQEVDEDGQSISKLCVADSQFISIPVVGPW